MRNFDSLGLELAQFQGEIFEKSISRYECSSLVFLRRFKNSNYASYLDSSRFNTLIDVEYAFSEIDKQYGKSAYGNQKYSADALYWLGYIYRYISYTRNTNTRFLMKTFDYEKLFELYYVYHTQDLEWCVENILELYGYTEDIFNPNYRLKEVMRKNSK